MSTIPDALATTRIQSPDGASAIIASHGAHLLSWIPAGGSEALFLSAQSGFGARDAIRGGVPIIFPQFGERGPGRRHGFARTAGWRLVFSDRAAARYVLAPEDVAASDWPHAFRLDYEVAIEARRLHLSLTVENPSSTAWQFNAALHTYLRVSDVAHIQVAGLQGVGYIDQAGHGRRAVQRETHLRIEGETDRIYLATPGPLSVHDGTRTVVSEQQGFCDTVIWNPGSEKGALLRDLAPGAHAAFVCVEAAAVDRPITLSPGARWVGKQILTIE